MIKYYLLIFALFGLSNANADDHAVILLYHHIATDTPPSTSVSPQVFEAHLDYLEDNGFSVLPLSQILGVLARNEKLPAKTVAITFDDAYLSVYSEAFPRLRQRGWPFTVFVSSAAIDSGFRNYLSWDQIRELSAAGVELANHSQSHAHLVRYLVGESDQDWQRRVSADIDHAAARLKAETGVDSNLFAYPYGEYSEALKTLVQSKGYFGIAQQSGAVGYNSDFLAVPRFPMSSGFADLNRLAISVNSRPLPVDSIETSKPDSISGRIDSLRITLQPGAYRAAQLACYDASGTRLKIRPGDQPTEISISLKAKQNPGRNKINCTAPANTEPGVFYWYSYQWLVKNEDGSWYQE